MKKWIKKVYKLFKEHRKRLNDTVKYVQQTNNVFRIVIVFDLFYSFVIYGCTINEYKIFDFYNVPLEQRDTYLTKSKKKSLFSTSIKKSKGKFTRKKIYNLFKEYLNREVKELKDISFKDFELLALDKKTLMFSDNNNKNKICVMNLCDFRSPAFMLDKAKKEGYEYVEEYKRPNKIFNKINKEGLCIVSIVTLKTYSSIDIVSSSLKLQTKDNLIETVLEKGIVKYPFLDKDDNVYRKLNDIELKNMEVPKYDELIELSKKLASEINDVKEIEWLFTLTDTKIELLGAGVWNNYLFAQKQIYLNGKDGIYAYYKTKRF